MVTSYINAERSIQLFKLGLQHLLESHLSLFRNRRVGLVTQAAAVLPDMTHCLDALLAAQVPLTAIYAPEHGLWGAAAEGEEIDTVIDKRSGLPIYSLYGKSYKPSPEMLAAVDLLVFDMQDIGTRYYTYQSTLNYLLQAASEAGKSVIVLDRPNPINGVTVEGARLPEQHQSFVGLAGLPNRHGLTIGEAARWLNRGAHFPAAELSVIPMLGWRRAMWFDETGLDWVPASPGMAHLHAVMLYPGSCLLEGINVSVGRGTSQPFEIGGAPWLDGNLLASEMNRLDLPGVRFRAHSFTPMGNVYAGQLCHGVQIHLFDRNQLQPLRMGLELIAMILRLFPEKATLSPHFDRLAGDARAIIEAGGSFDAIVAEPQDYRSEMDKYLLYD